MRPRSIAVIGGAGFVGSNLALAFKREFGDADVLALDNLKRRGSELMLARLREGGVRFEHGDVRNADDLEALGRVELIVECSAEPSVHAGYDGGAAYLVDTNLFGAFNCLEYARRHGSAIVFLSTSRVYPIAGLRDLPLEEGDTRLVPTPGRWSPGWSENGISEEFPLTGSRSLYGATKLSAELLIEEYRAAYGLRAIVNRCGVIAGPWQMGKVDQGVVALWMARHVFGGSLSYMGFGGHGMQVRDLLHVDDLYDLIRAQMDHFERHSCGAYNVGGGLPGSLSLRELTGLCQRISGARLDIASDPHTREADVPYYVSDNAKVTKATGWKPRRSPERILTDVHSWLTDHREALAPLFT